MNRTKPARPFVDAPLRGPHGCRRLARLVPPFLLLLVTPGLTTCCPPKPKEPAKVGDCERVTVPRPDLRRHRQRKCVTLTKVSSRVDRSTSNVWVMFRARECGKGGAPVTDMHKDDFEVFEAAGTQGANFHRISGAESEQDILPRQLSSTMYFLILLDMSGSIRKAPGGVAFLQRGAKLIVTEMRHNWQVAVAAFTGSENIHLLQDYTNDLDSLRAAINRLSTWIPKDKSTNLYGAYIKGLQSLQHQMKQTQGRFTHGTLFLLTDGADQAARRTKYHAMQFRRGVVPDPDPWNQGKPVKLRHPLLYTVYTRSARTSEEIDEKTLRDLADPGGYHSYGSLREFSTKAQQMAREFDKLGRSFHVLSYCSPKRAGTHVVKVQVSHKSRRFYPPRHPRTQGSGAVVEQFSASGFTSGCSAARVRQALAACGVPGKTCQDPGTKCDGYRCVSREALARKAREKAARIQREQAARRRALVMWKEGKARAARVYGACQRTRARRVSGWSTYRARYEQWKQGDCGFRLMAEGGIRLYPAPQGVAGSFLLGWSFRRWVEIHAGVGLLPATLLMQVRVKPLSWRWLDLMVVPRVGVGLQKKPWTFEAELLLGLRARIGRYFAMYLQLGPGYAQSEWGSVKEKGFFLPGWLGVELRL